MITCCLTTFNPCIDRLEKCLNSIFTQVDKLIVIDNNSGNKFEINNICKEKNIEVIFLEENLGIAKAQNIVWGLAIENKSEFIIFSDQDTIFPEEAIQKLVACLRLQPKCAAIAPVFRDINASRPLEYSVNIFEYPYKFILEDTDVRIVSHVISSGMVVRNDVVHTVGMNREELFIDWVDSEWCWRAHLKGFNILQTGAVTLEHILGENRIEIGNKKITRHKLFRSYYKIRNAIIIMFDVNNFVIRKHLIIHTAKNIVLTFFSKGRLVDKLKIIFNAVNDGIKYERSK